MNFMLHNAQLYFPFVGAENFTKVLPAGAIQHRDALARLDAQDARGVVCFRAGQAKQATAALPGWNMESVHDFQVVGLRLKVPSPKSDTERQTDFGLWTSNVDRPAC